jgi:hypothetical protein
LSIVPHTLKNPCNCFGKCGMFETQQYFHEMGMEGCVKSIPPAPSNKDDQVASRFNMREFGTGATRTPINGKVDFEAYLSPLALHAYALHMLKHQADPSGEMREADNWQLGIPMDAYIKSGWRHFFDVWMNHRGVKRHRKEKIVTALCATLFNLMGYLHEYLKANPEVIEQMEKDVGYER